MVLDAALWAGFVTCTLVSRTPTHVRRRRGKIEEIGSCDIPKVCLSAEEGQDARVDSSLARTCVRWEDCVW